ncbi:Clp protease [Microbacterium foliorum]|uniref:Clp amino terminal domain protein n=1 Tax=Microbacterium foliorum TaxID=104336 RepID=A0A0F0KW04_9MICO|nr:Clp protease N-terminal domain-containing protein [Microbacterium foliorum]AXL13437.1 Clp protease [Microbacterium foliorum]KJL25097.1 Clp amino terminal domain protein [Microbacterium foliorum]
MSRFARAAHTSHSLSVAAMEEASRAGLRTADIDHLLLALIINDQSAGRMLRGAGLDIDAARRAVEDQHAHHLAGLGIETSFPAAGQIVFPQTEGYEWSTRASDLLIRASGRRKAGDAAAVLRELLTEPSGLIDGILARLGTSAQALLEQLDELGADDTTTPLTAVKRHGRAAGSIETFVSAPVEDVGAFLADPALIPEWHPGVGSLELGRQEVAAGEVWEGLAPTERLNGEPVQRKPELRRRRITLVSLDRPERVAWSFAYPDAPKNSPVLMEFTLAGTTGGTQVHTTMSWARRGGWRGIVALPMRPLQKFMLWIMLAQTSAAISRSFR